MKYRMNSRERNAICDMCGTPFYYPPYYLKRNRKHRFCSRKCYADYKKTFGGYNNKEKTIKTCPICRKNFSVWPSIANRRKCCSLECGDIMARKNKLPSTCKNCGVKISSNRIFCGHKCYFEFMRKSRKERTDNLVTCKVCGKVFITKTITKKATYCSLNCYGKDAVRLMDNRTHNGRGGKREDLNGQYFRSSWEANYARYLNWLISIGEIQSWEFEPETFEFVKIKKGNRFYTPDFRITNNDGSIEFHEIKGYMDENSATKLKRMSKYYPDIKLVLIDKDAYRALAKSVRALITGWEENPKHGY